MLLRLVFLALFTASLPASSAQAFIFLLAAGGNRKPPPPPTLHELPAMNADKVIRPSGLPAPFLMRPIVAPMPPVAMDGKAPVLSSPSGQVAQVSNEELLRRLERLEAENQRLRQQGQMNSAAPRSGLPSASLPAQTTPGWWVHVYNWDARGELNGEPQQTFRYPQRRFNATINFRETNALQWTEIYVYRFEGWLRVREAGTYQLGAEITCPFNHPCNFFLKIDGVQIAQVQRQTLENKLVYSGRHLEPGDYRLEMIWGIANNSFMKYRPNATTLRPVIRTQQDMNFRDFAQGELLVPDRRDVPPGPPMQNVPGW